MATKTPKTQKQAAAAPATSQAAQTTEPRYYIVNPKGCVHVVTKEHGAWRLKNFVGYRQATREEIAKYKATRVQRAGRPIGTPFAPEEALEPDLEGVVDEIKEGAEAE